jgi:hypothetical protein
MITRVVVKNKNDEVMYQERFEGPEMSKELCIALTNKLRNSPQNVIPIVFFTMCEAGYHRVDDDQTREFCV